MEENNQLPNFEDHIPGKSFSYGIMAAAFAILFGAIFLIKRFDLEAAPLFLEVMQLFIWLLFGLGSGFLVLHDNIKRKRKKLSFEGAFTTEQFEDIVPSTGKIIGWALLIVFAAILSYYQLNRALTFTEILIGQELSFLYIKKKFADFKLELQFYTTK